MSNLLKQLATSKKFLAALVAVVVAAGARYGLNLDPETVGILIAPLIAYIVAQGQADKGKHAAAITALASIAPSKAIEKIQK